MAKSPGGRGRTPFAEDHWGPLRATPNGRGAMGVSAQTERLGAPLNGDPNCCDKASSSKAWRLFGGGSEGAP
eukprot:5679365-Alexandrium_andersonii.AAC.1